MADKKNDDSCVRNSSFLRWSILTAAAILIVAVFTDSGCNCSSSNWRDSLGQPRHPRAMEPAKPKIDKVSIPLDIEKWSDWQSLSPGKTFRISHSGWLEMKFINGEVKRCEKGMNVYAGKIKESIFRLRGEGEMAILYIEDTEQ